MKGCGRIGLIALAAIAVLALALWLNFPSSVILFFQGIGPASRPAVFTFRFTGSSKPMTSARVTIYYMPKTPILGITEHWWSIIAPASIDSIRREQPADVVDGVLRIEVPTAISGLSNYRLNLLTIELPQGRADPMHIDLGPTSDEEAPVTSAIPVAQVSGGKYTFDGAYPLWRLTGDRDEENNRAYSPRATGTTRQVLWPGLRSFDATIDLGSYPVPTFQAPTGWQGEGWKPLGINLTRSNADLTDTVLTMHRNAELRIPFARDCTREPAFVVVNKQQQPAWSNLNGLWAPVAPQTWSALQHEKPASGLAVSFVPKTPVPEDGVELVTVRSQGPGTYRIFAACPEPAAASVAVGWLDVKIH